MERKGASEKERQTDRGKWYETERSRCASGFTDGVGRGTFRLNGETAGTDAE